MHWCALPTKTDIAHRATPTGGCCGDFPQLGQQHLCRDSIGARCLAQGVERRHRAADAGHPSAQERAQGLRPGLHDVLHGKLSRHARGVHSRFAQPPRPRHHCRPMSGVAPPPGRTPAKHGTATQAPRCGGASCHVPRLSSAARANLPPEPEMQTGSGADDRSTTLKSLTPEASPMERHPDEACR